jgi:hypothetical protein
VFPDFVSNPSVSAELQPVIGVAGIGFGVRVLVDVGGGDVTVGVYVNCSVGVIVGVLDGVEVRLGVKVRLGVNVGLDVNVGVNGGVTTIETLKITVRALVAVIGRDMNGTRLGRIGLNCSVTVATILCSLSLSVAAVRLVSVAPLQ